MSYFEKHPVTLRELSPYNQVMNYLNVGKYKKHNQPDKFQVKLYVTYSSTTGWAKTLYGFEEVLEFLLSFQQIYPHVECWCQKDFICKEELIRHGCRLYETPRNRRKGLKDQELNLANSSLAWQPSSCLLE